MSAVSSCVLSATTCEGVTPADWAGEPVSRAANGLLVARRDAAVVMVIGLVAPCLSRVCLPVARHLNTSWAAATERGGLGCRQRFAVPETLCLMAAVCDKEVGLFLVFHAFSHAAQIEALSECDYGRRDGLVIGVGRDVAHE